MIVFWIDIDVLLVKEEINFFFVFKYEGYMYVCGYDGYMVMFLGLIDFIIEYIEEFIYNVVLIY